MIFLWLRQMVFARMKSMFGTKSLQSLLHAGVEKIRRIESAFAPRIRSFSDNRRENKKWALLSYLADAVRMKDTDARLKFHSNWWECREIARILCRLGYNVEAIWGRDATTVPPRQYDLIIDQGRNIQRLAPYQKSSTKYILLLTGSHFSWSIEAERIRVDAFEKRHGVHYALRYGAMPTALLDKSLEMADTAMLIGNETTLSTYPKRFREIIVPIPATPSVCPFKKTYRSSSKSFLFFSGPCNVLKGLDLALDVFLRHPDWTLNIVGRHRSERDFVKAYPQVEKATNIRFHGFLTPDSTTFGQIIDDCSAFLAPTCTEGSSTAAILLCTAGLFPIISNRIGVDLPTGCGKVLQSLDVESLETAIGSFLSIPHETIAADAERIRHAVSEKYNRDNFIKTVQTILYSVS